MVGPEARDYKQQYLAALLQFTLTETNPKIPVYILQQPNGGLDLFLACNREGNKKTFRRPSAPGHEMFFLIQAYCMLLACNREGKNKHFVARIFFTDGMWV